MKKEPNKKQNNTSWGKVTEWYDALLASDDSYQAKVVLPNLLRVLGITRGMRVLDIACGQGFFSRAAAGEGASVVGADISRELVELAEKKGPKEISYHVAPADRMSFAMTGTFDAALCVLALQNIENLNGALAETARVLKEGGTFVFVLNHPAFRVPKYSSWGWDEKAGTQYRRIDHYMTESRAEIEMHPGKKVGAKTVSFHRPLQSYVKALSKNGFAITGFEEWISHKKSEPGPRAKGEDVARKEFPLFLMIKAVLLK